MFLSQSNQLEQKTVDLGGWTTQISLIFPEVKAELDTVDLETAGSHDKSLCSVLILTSEDGDAREFYRRRVVEIKHGRVSMLACTGYIVQEFFRFPGYISPSSELKFTDIPNGLAAATKVPAVGWFQYTIFCGICDLWLLHQVPTNPAGKLCTRLFGEGATNYEYGFLGLPGYLGGKAAEKRNEDTTITFCIPCSDIHKAMRSSRMPSNRNHSLRWIGMKRPIFSVLSLWVSSFPPMVDASGCCLNRWFFWVSGAGLVGGHRGP